MQAAWIEEQVNQCGYCINGWILTAVELLERNPKPTDAQIKEALNDLICRCGTHGAALKAVQSRRAAGVRRRAMTRSADTRSTAARS